jgi:hypothetical protein
MIDFKKKYIKTIRLNSFRPLCITPIGMRAISEHGCKPFIDASCRREPDFESNNPSITSLCRQEMFAPNLYPNDIIVYITVKGKWFRDYDHHRLIAILEVINKRENHMQAASWYKTNCETGIPSNCMVPSNPPSSFHETAGNYEKKSDTEKFLSYSNEKQQLIGERRIEIWNNDYLLKSKKWGDFIITKPIFRQLIDPPILLEGDMKKIFGKVPNTRNPNKITKEQFRELAKHADINFISG